MGDSSDCTHSPDDRVLSVVPRREENITVVFHKVANDDDDNESDDERTTERIHLQSNSHVSCNDDVQDDEDEAVRGRAKSVNSSDKQRLCLPALCFSTKSNKETTSQGGNTLDKGSRRFHTEYYYLKLSILFY